jgi:adenylate cyclase
VTGKSLTADPAGPGRGRPGAWRRSILPGLGWGLLTGLVVAALYVVGVPLLELVELRAVDLRFRSVGSDRPRLKQVAVVAVDERSLAAEGQWVWPRTTMARLIRAVDAAGARVIAVDVGFFEPDNRFTRAQVRRLRADPSLTPDRIPRPDDVLARAVKDARGKVILGYFFHMTPAQTGRLTAAQIKARRGLIAPFKFVLTRAKPPDALQKSPFITAWAPQPIIQVLARASGRGGAGHFNIFPDYDGTIRRVPLVIAWQGGLYPSMVAAAAARFVKAPFTMVRVGPAGVEAVRLGPKIVIPTDRYGQMLIRFQGPADVVPTFSAADVLRGRHRADLRGRLVFIGTTAVGTFEQRVTPFSPVAPGVTIQARAVQNVLSGRFLARPVWARAADLVLIVGLAVGLGLLLALVPPWLGGLGCVLVYAGLVLTAFRLFDRGVIIAVIYPLLAIILVFAAMTVWRHFTQGREKKRLKGAFQSYVSPEVVRTVTENPDRLGLHGEKRELTVLMSDIRSFTTLSESTEPEKLAHILNIYMDVMTEIVFDHGGLLDKYIGDAIMAVWGAPLPSDDHAARACAAALDMEAALPGVRAQWAEQGVDAGLDIGIGINTGPMIVGNMGSSRRFDYTVIGDEVNVAARLEGQTKAYGVVSVVGETTVNQCQDRFSFRPLDMVRLKGRLQPTILYTLAGTCDGDEPELVQCCRAGFSAFLGRDWAAALEHYRLAAGHSARDRAIQVMVERLNRFVDDPPPDGWDWVPRPGK